MNMNGNGQTEIPETEILELTVSLMNNQNLPTANQTMANLGEIKPLFVGCLPSKRLKHKRALKTPEQVVEEFRKKLGEMKSPDVIIVNENEKVEQKKVLPEKKQVPAPKKAKKLQSSRAPIVWTKPKGEQSDWMWVVFKEKTLSNEKTVISAEARCNGNKVWVKPKVPLKKEDLGYLRPVRIPWWETAEFSNVFTVELPAFSEKRVQMGNEKVIVIDSSVYFSQEVLQRKGSFAVLFKEDLVFVHVKDKKLRDKKVYQALNAAQREENGVGNSWTILGNGLLRSPEKSRVSDETILSVLETVLEKK